LSGGTQAAQPLLPRLRLDGRLDSRSTSKSVWRCGWVLQRPEFPAPGGVDLGGRDVRLGSTASGHSAFSACSTGSEHELSAFPRRRGDRIAVSLLQCVKSRLAQSGPTKAAAILSAFGAKQTFRHAGLGYPRSRMTPS